MTDHETTRTLAMPTRGSFLVYEFTAQEITTGTNRTGLPALALTLPRLGEAVGNEAP